MIDLRALRRDPIRYKRLILKKDPSFPFDEFHSALVSRTKCLQVAELAKKEMKELFELVRIGEINV